MASYVIGDVHGCYQSFCALLQRINYREDRDQLWFTGDLVNRGPQSLAMLKWAYEHRDNICVVLGNHDLHLLARSADISPKKRRDTLDSILESPHREVWLRWLRTQPLMYQDEHWALVHAGILPCWTLSEASTRAQAISSHLSGDDWRQIIAQWRHIPSERSIQWATHWKPDLSAEEIQATTLNAFCRIRMVRRDDHAVMDFSYNGPPQGASHLLRPWYATISNSEHKTIIFGHWAALGCHSYGETICIDSGCVWGGYLTAYCLDDSRIIKQPCVDIGCGRDC